MAAMKGGGYIEGRPKKLVKARVNTLNYPRLLVMVQRNVTEVKVVKS